LGRKTPLLAALVLAAGLSLASDYEWTQSVSTAYDDCDNWAQPNPPACEYPDSASDRAIFPWDNGQDWTVLLIPETIDELVVEDNVDFTSDDETVTFAAKVTVDAAEGDIEVTIGNTTIIAVP
jgi:hypothetical protein